MVWLNQGGNRQANKSVRIRTGDNDKRNLLMPKQLMKVSPLLMILAIYGSCKKDEDKKTCYECYQGAFFNEVGCYTQQEWKEITLRTLDGRELDKNNCRKK